MNSKNILRAAHARRESAPREAEQMLVRVMKEFPGTHDAEIAQGILYRLREQQGWLSSSAKAAAAVVNIPPATPLTFFGIALGVAILMAAILPIGGYILLAIISPTELRGLIGSFGTHLILMCFKYLLPAYLLYSLFKYFKLDEKYRFKKVGNGLVLAGCTLVLTFGLARAFASLVEGGGGSFALALYAKFVLFPAWLLIFVGVVKFWRNRQTLAQGRTVVEGVT